MKFPAMLRRSRTSAWCSSASTRTRTARSSVPEFLAACAELEVKDVDDDILRDIYAEADVDGRGSVISAILPRLARGALPHDRPTLGRGELRGAKAGARRPRQGARGLALLRQEKRRVPAQAEVTEALVSFEADSKGHEGVSATPSLIARQVRGDGLGQVTAGVLPGVSPRRGGMGGIGRGRRRVIRT